MNPTDPFGLVGQVLDGQFRVDRLVGEGGFSVVYKGHHQGLNEPIAVKCLKLPVALGTNLVETFVQRFRDESRILYRLSQGNLHIVRSIAAGTTQAPATGALVPYMVLEWLEGRSLQNDFTVRRTTGQSGRSLDEVIKLFETAADALGFAHAQGVVHRDMNAGNIFLSITAQGIKTKVLDFGVAKIMHDSALNLGPRAQTMGQLRIFAPAYGAPEQFDDRIGPVGAWSDVYSLALIMLEALRDRPVNEAANLGSFAQIAIDPSRRPTPRALGIQVPDEVEAAFARATALDPKQRWQSASEFWKALTIGMNVASERKFEKAARETPPLAVPQPQPHHQALRGKDLQRTMPLASSALVRPGAPTVRPVTQRPPPVAGTGTTPGVPPIRTGSGSLPAVRSPSGAVPAVTNVPMGGPAPLPQGSFKSAKQTMALAGGPPRPPEVIADRAPPRIEHPTFEEDEEDEETRVNEAGPEMLRTLALIDAEKAKAAALQATAHMHPPIEDAEEPTRFNPIVAPPEARPTVEPPEPVGGMNAGASGPPNHPGASGPGALGGTFMMAPQRPSHPAHPAHPSHPLPAPSGSALYTPPPNTTPSQGTGVAYSGQSQITQLPQGSQAGPPPQDPRFSQMQGPHGVPYGQQSQGYLPPNVQNAPNAPDASPWARHSIDQAAPPMIQAQPPPAKKSPVVAIAVVCAVLALGGIGLTAYAVTARRAHVPTPAASVSASAEPVASASAEAPPVEKAAEPPPVATAVEADAAPAVAEAPDAAPAAPEEPPAASASAAPSASAPPTPAPTHTAVTPTATAVPVPVPVPVPTPKASASAAPAVDPNAWNEANARARLSTANGILVICKKGNVTGPGTASVTFGTDGTVTNVTVDPPYAGTKEGDCAAGQFRRVKVNPFVGSPQTVRHSFDVPK